MELRKIQMQWNPATRQFLFYHLVITTIHLFGLKKRWNTSFSRLSQRVSGRSWKNDPPAGWEELGFRRNSGSRPKLPLSLPSSYAASAVETLANVGLHSHSKRCPRQEWPNIHGASIVFRHRRMSSQTLLILLTLWGFNGVPLCKASKDMSLIGLEGGGRAF